MTVWSSRGAAEAKPPDANAWDADVVVIGADVAGLTLALALEQAGASVVVVDRRDTARAQSAVASILPQTMALFDRWGVGERVRRAELSAVSADEFVWTTRMNRIELGRGSLAITDQLRDAEHVRRPARPRAVPLDALTSVLLDELRAVRPAAVRVTDEVRGVAVDDFGVAVSLGGPYPQLVRARYAVRADNGGTEGAKRTSTREGGERLPESTIQVVFRADLATATGGRRYQHWCVVNREVQGIFAQLSGDGLWSFEFEGTPGGTVDYDDVDVCRQLIGAGVGLPDLDIAVVAVNRMHRRRESAPRRCGRLFALGSATSDIPVIGGIRLAGAIDDAANLAWKLAAVIHGHGGEQLLDSYVREREPVAVQHGRSVADLCRRVDDVLWLTKDPRIMRTIEEPFGKPARRAVAAAMANLTSVRYGVMRGDRLPVVSGRDRYGRPATLSNLLGGGFAAVVGRDGAAWAHAAAEVSRGCGVDIRVVIVGSHPNADLTVTDPDDLAVLGMGDGGAILVRPDSHVALQVPKGSEDSAAYLGAAMQAALTGAGPICGQLISASRVASRPDRWGIA